MYRTGNIYIYIYIYIHINIYIYIYITDTLCLPIFSFNFLSLLMSHIYIYIYIYTLLFKNHSKTEPMLWKMCHNPLWGENYMKLAYIKQNCCQETSAENSKQCLKYPMSRGVQRLDNQAVPYESKFEIFGSQKRMYVLRRDGRRAALSCITTALKHERGFIIV